MENESISNPIIAVCVFCVRVCACVVCVCARVVSVCVRVLRKGSVVNTKEQWWFRDCLHPRGALRVGERKSARM